MKKKMTYDQLSDKARSLDHKLNSLRMACLAAKNNYISLSKQIEKEQKELEKIWDQSVSVAPKSTKTFSSVIKIADAFFDEAGAEYYHKTRNRILSGGSDAVSWNIKRAIVYIFWYYTQEKYDNLGEMLRKYFGIKKGFANDTISHCITSAVNGNVNPPNVNLIEFLNRHKLKRVKD